MSDPIGALITGATSLIGAGIGAVSQKSAGDQAAQVQRETNAMQVDLANTAHQREIKDLKAAGLNPLLSGTGGQGANTPTLKAPTQSAEGYSKAGEIAGNAMANLSSQIMQYMTGQQQIELMKANTENTKADTENKLTTGKYIAPKAELGLTEGTQRVVESTQRTKESEARTATIELMRDPTLRNLVENIANTAQRTKTEYQRTKETTEAANVAKRLYGARALEAETLASQVATYYKEFFLKDKNRQIDKADLEIELLRNTNFQKVIENTLANEYGRMNALSKMDWLKLLGPSVMQKTTVDKKHWVTPRSN